MYVRYSVWFFSLWGWNGVWFVALQDLTPVSRDVFCPLFLFLWWIGCFRRRRFSLFLRRWGNPNLFMGFGIPLVSLHPGRVLRLQLAGLAPHLPQGHRPAPVFFFFSPLASLGSWWWLVSSCSGGVFVCIACKMYNAQSFFWREGDHGNRTVTQCQVLVSGLPPARKGKCCPFFHFGFFVSGSMSFAVFCRSALLRVAV